MPVITSDLAVVPVGEYVTWHVAIGTTMPAGRLIVHGDPVNEPVPLLANDTVPVGIMPVPTSVSLTSAVQIVDEPKLIDAGAHVIVVVVVRNGATVNEILVEWLAPPPLALMVIVKVPRVAVTVVANDTVTVHVGLHGLFVKVAVTPLGRPDALNVTAVVVPLTRVAVMEELELVDPWKTLRVLGDGVERLKSNAGGLTVNMRLVE